MTIVMEGSKGGERRAGIELLGLARTGVFIDEVKPKSEAHHRGLLQKGDQVLKLNNKDTGE